MIGTIHRAEPDAHVLGLCQVHELHVDAAVPAECENLRKYGTDVFRPEDIVVNQQPHRDSMPE
jgi:hypothetical protein